jgi:hypothetical protein
MLKSLNGSGGAYYTTTTSETQIGRWCGRSGRYGHQSGSHPSIIATRAAAFTFIPNTKSGCLGAHIILTQFPPSRRRQTKLSHIWILLHACAKSDRVAGDCIVLIIDPGIPYAASRAHYTTPYRQVGGDQDTFCSRS